MRSLQVIQQLRCMLFPGIKTCGLPLKTIYPQGDSIILFVSFSIFENFIHVYRKICSYSPYHCFPAPVSFGSPPPSFSLLLFLLFLFFFLLSSSFKMICEVHLELSYLHQYEALHRNIDSLQTLNTSSHGVVLHVFYPMNAGISANLISYMSNAGSHCCQWVQHLYGHVL